MVGDPLEIDVVWPAVVDLVSVDSVAFDVVKEAVDVVEEAVDLVRDFA